MEEKCIIIVEGDNDFTTVTYDGIDITSFIILGDNKAIVPAGRKTLTVTLDKRITLSRRKYTVDHGDHTETITEEEYIPYTEVWSIEYDFEPDKTYGFLVYTANIGYNPYHYEYNPLMLDDPLRYQELLGKPVITDTEGVEASYDGAIIFTHVDPDDLEIHEDGGAIAGGTYIGPYSTTVVDFVGWDYGPAIPKFGMGQNFGLEILGNTFGWRLLAEGMGHVGIAWPWHETPSDFMVVTADFTYAARTEFVFKTLSFGVGAGMTHGARLSTEGMFNNEDDDVLRNKYRFPYGEARLMFFGLQGGGELPFISLYGRYLFNDDEHWYNKFALGLDMRF